MYSYLVRNNWLSWWWPKERPKHVVVPTICYMWIKTPEQQFKVVWHYCTCVYNYMQHNGGDSLGRLASHLGPLPTGEEPWVPAGQEVGWASEAVWVLRWRGKIPYAVSRSTTTVLPRPCGHHTVCVVQTRSLRDYLMQYLTFAFFWMAFMDAGFLVYRNDLFVAVTKYMCRSCSHRAAFMAYT